MSTSTISQTALGTCAGRALETLNPPQQQLFNDPLAMEMLPSPYGCLVRLLNLPLIGDALLKMRERQIPGVMGNLLCRTRFIDDELKDALWEGFDQVVILGAGFDTRPYRIAAPEGVRFYELDHPSTQALKREKVVELQQAKNVDVQFVPVDFDLQDIIDPLLDAGFRREDRTLVIWEGVTQYIAPESVDRTLRDLEDLLSHGSRLLFTYVVKAFLDGDVDLPCREKMMAEMEKRGEPWRFGLASEALEEFLKERGFLFMEDVGAPEYEARYLSELGRVLDVFPAERVAVAERSFTLDD